jgi:hypothetical protein
VIGTAHEDEPYAVAVAGPERAAGEVVVVGRSRRNPGFDNTQWDPWLASLDGAGGLLASRTLPSNALGILLSAAIDPAGGVVAGGSDGWTQNPDGLSILSFGADLLFRLSDRDADAPVRIPLAPGPRHSEIRAVAVTFDGVWFAGHDDGPITHTGDADPAAIHATSVVGLVPR